MTIDPRAVMRQYTVEELCETADEYYRRVADATPLMSKPFAFLHETPEMLQNLGLLLAGLQLGKTMTVLDFGAGTCWLSRILAQLNCQPICCDASAAALEIGKRLFDEHPPIGLTVFQPRFLPFDGHHIDLPDASVDRIVCFDAFHHIPNPAEIISEFGRVLRPGGMAGFSEPGREHSKSPQSQYEMRHHRVLENDIDLNAIFGYARTAGFTSLTAKVLTDMEVSLDGYNAFFDGSAQQELRSELWNQTHNTMFNRSIFFLHKGSVERDSRSHIGLSHTMTIGVREISVQRGTPLEFDVTLHNSGDATWLHTNNEIHGVVRLGTHLHDAAGRLLEVDYSRHNLPQSVRPGETLRMAATVPLPERDAFRLTFDLVAEGVTWFETQGSTAITVAVAVI